MKKLILNAIKRTGDDGRAAKIAQAGQVPAVLYGGDKQNEHLKLGANDIDQTYAIAGESSLIDLSVDKAGAIKVIIKNIQRNPVNDKIIHVDFYRVDMNKPIDVEIPLKFIGDPKAVKDLGGTLIKSLESIRANCLPADLPENIEVNINPLETFSDTVKVSDLRIDKKIKVINSPEDAVASVLVPRLVDEDEEEKKKIAEGEEKAKEAEGEEKAEGADGGKGKDKEKTDKKSDGK
ncbi:50S ribosomal protein L25 [Candidatus Parcubacteria bacterium]|nr:50S ribosomal protein L25 [Candidatus Parcubacteria bacterium]